MLFNSLQFALFFIIVYGLYLVSNHKWQNRMLLVASYVFYGAWDWRFLSLIWVSTIIDYICGIKLDATDNIKKRKQWLCLSIFSNLSILGFFKYFDFFAANFQRLAGQFGFSIQPTFLHIILPVGISFYTFQTMSYTIDIYRNEMKPTRRFFDFALFVAFFPQLVAGPIERARHLLPQMLSPRKLSLDKFYEGCYLIFWGLFMKVFVSDNLATIVDPVFASASPYGSAQVLLAMYAFSFQIFCDFAGYSNIARGLGKLMGFDIMVNFRLPYFATNPQEFWQRWHISLSTWLRDYLYVPLGGNRRGSIITYRNLAIVMLLGGLWHGASWTFIVWGAYQGALLIIHRLLKPLLKKIPDIKNNMLKGAWFYIRVIFFFNLISIGFLIFRAPNVQQAFYMMKSLSSGFSFVLTPGIVNILWGMFSALWLLLILQYVQHKQRDLVYIYKVHWLLRGVIYFVMIWLLVHSSVGYAKPFIYFQF